MESINKFSAGGVVLRGKEVLTLYVPDHDETVFPKGTIEGNETPEATAVREVLEETGYHTEIFSPLNTTSYEFEEDGKHVNKTVHYFVMTLTDENEIPEPHREQGEVFENQWLSIDDARSRLTHEENKQLLTKALEIASLA